MCLCMHTTYVCTCAYHISFGVSLHIMCLHNIRIMYIHTSILLESALDSKRLSEKIFK